MTEISNDELTRRVRLAHDFCEYCNDSSKTRQVGPGHDEMMFFFHGVDLAFEGEGRFDIYMGDKCIKCFESNHSRPVVAQYLEDKLSSHLLKKEEQK